MVGADVLGTGGLGAAGMGPVRLGIADWVFAKGLGMSRSMSEGMGCASSGRRTGWSCWWPREPYSGCALRSRLEIVTCNKVGSLTEDCGGGRPAALCSGDCLPNMCFRSSVEVCAVAVELEGPVAVDSEMPAVTVLCEVEVEARDSR